MKYPRVLLLALVLTSSFALRAQTLLTLFQAYSFTSPTGGTLPYRLMPPEDAVPGQKYPLLIALHGLGGKGTNNTAQLNLGNPQLDPHIRATYKSFTLLPQGNDDFSTFNIFADAGSVEMATNPSNSTRMTLELIDHLIANNPDIDPERVYLVGESMGGSGVFEFLARRPDLFASGVPVYLGGTPGSCSIIAENDIPIRLMNNDQSIPWSRDRLLLHGADVAHVARLLGDEGHKGWTENFAWDNYALWKWMFAQRKDGPRVRVSHSNGSTVVTEYGPGDSVEVWLKTQPAANVTVTPQPDSQITVTPATLTFTPANWNVKQSLAVNAVSDTLNEGVHAGLLLFQAASADADYQAPPIQSLEVKVMEGDAEVVFTQPVWSVKENAGSVTLQVQPVGAYMDTVSVQYASAGGSATAGADFSAVSGTLTWAAGDDSAREIIVPILNDSLAEGGESFTVTLSNPVGIQLGDTSTAEVRILDGQSPGVIRLETKYNSTVEDQQSITFTAEREGGYAGAVSVRAVTIDGSAKAGSDYTALDLLLTWADGDTTPRPITVFFADDAEPEPTETFILALTEPVGVPLGSPSSDTITLKDNDGYSVGFEDSFDDGGRSNGADLKDLDWYSQTNGNLVDYGVPRIRIEDGAGFEKALLSVKSELSIIAALPQALTLEQTGDFLEFRLRFSRLITKNFSSGIRLGVFQHDSPPAAETFGTAFDAALGYLAGFPSGSGTNTRIRKDSLPTDNLLNDNQNTSTGQLTISTATGLVLPRHDADPAGLPVTLRLRLERVDTGLRITTGLTPNGGLETTLSIIDADQPLLAFNCVGIGIAKDTAATYWDDFVFETGGPSFELPNTPPSANPDSFEVLQHAPALALDVLRNDSDADGDGLILTDVSAPALGSVDNQSTRLWYTPPATAGTDSFSYTLSDGRATSTATVTITVLPDSDRDGMDDDWEALHELGDPDADEDDDGLSNRDEYIAGTDPGEATSGLTLTPTPEQTFVDTVPGREYKVEYSETLAPPNWQTLLDWQPGTGNPLSWSPPDSLNAVFFRVLLRKP